MFNGWRKFNKIMLWISMIAGFIFTIALTAVTASSYYMRDYAWIICVGGLIIVALFHCLWGLFIEMAMNIERISTNTYSTNSIKSGSNYENGNSSVSPMTIGEKNWRCSSCGAENPHVNQFCQGCGIPKNGMGDKS